jgi:hypothetical protein
MGKITGEIDHGRLATRRRKKKGESSMLSP